jgi:uncharacterized protein (TIGR04255 family)
MDAVNRFEPMHDAHAIEFVQFCFNFSKPLSDDTIKRVTHIMDTFETPLPVRQELRQHSITIGVNLSPPMSSGAGAFEGVIRQRIAPNGAIEKELRVDRSGISFRDASYTRWQQVWGRCHEFVLPLLQSIGIETFVNVIQLQYVDKFIWAGDARECRANLLLKEGSDYLSPSIFNSRDLWHSHAGHFVRLNSSVKRLVQINVDHLEEAGEGDPRQVVRAQTVLIDMLNQPGYEQNLTGFQSELAVKLQEMHDQLKSMFGELITDQIAHRIGMK